MCVCGKPPTRLLDSHVLLTSGEVLAKLRRAREGTFCSGAEVLRVWLCWVSVRVPVVDGSLCASVCWVSVCVCLCAVCVCSGLAFVCLCLCWVGVCARVSVAGE